MAVGQAAKVQSEVLPRWRKRKSSGKVSVKEDERGRVSLLGGGTSLVPQGAMLTSSARTADRQNPCGCCGRKHAKALRRLCLTLLPSWPTDGPCRLLLLHEVHARHPGGKRRGPNPTDERREGWHTTARHSHNRAGGTHRRTRLLSERWC